MCLNYVVKMVVVSGSRLVMMVLWVVGILCIVSDENSGKFIIIFIVVIVSCYY